ncbi:MAG: uracil-DNA glycosylase family protein [Cyanobacteria bacterium P01_H01_bin.15]
MSAALTPLLDAIHQEAQRETFPVDIPVYQSVKKDPLQPILYAGNLTSPLCFFGRDLGRDEVAASQPLIGAAGTLVRRGLFNAIHQRAPANQTELNTILQRVVLTNTVPYKPPGNKAYAVGVKERFRPFIEQLLVCHWQGNQIITLGTEAFKWFIPYGRKGEVMGYWGDRDRYAKTLPVTLTATDSAGQAHQKTAQLMPLPHPSPLNKQYYSKFPDMLQQRLNQIPF